MQVVKIIEIEKIIFKKSYDDEIKDLKTNLIPRNFSSTTITVYTKLIETIIKTNSTKHIKLNVLSF